MATALIGDITLPQRCCRRLHNSQLFSPPHGQGDRNAAMDMSMAVSSIVSTQTFVKDGGDGAVYQVVDVSDEESESTDTMAGLPRVNGVDGFSGVQLLETSDDEDSGLGSEDDDDYDSTFDETVGEMDDQQLFAGGECPGPEFAHFISR